MFALLFVLEQRRTQAEMGAILSAYLSNELLHNVHDWGSGPWSPDDSAAGSTEPRQLEMAMESVVGSALLVPRFITDKPNQFLSNELRSNGRSNRVASAEWCAVHFRQPQGVGTSRTNRLSNEIPEQLGIRCGFARWLESDQERNDLLHRSLLRIVWGRGIRTHAEGKRRVACRSTSTVRGCHNCRKQAISLRTGL